METTNKKECPKCKNDNIRDTGVRMGAAVAVLPGRETPEPAQPLYECEDCRGSNFL